MSRAPTATAAGLSCPTPASKAYRSRRGELRDQLVGRDREERHEVARQRELPEQLLRLGKAAAIEILDADFLPDPLHLFMHRLLEIGARDLNAAFELDTVFE